MSATITLTNNEKYYVSENAFEIKEYINSHPRERLIGLTLPYEENCGTPEKLFAIDKILYIDGIYR